MTAPPPDEDSAGLGGKARRDGAHHALPGESLRHSLQLPDRSTCTRVEVVPMTPGDAL